MEARLIDVREYPEFAQGHIKGAQLIPLGPARTAFYSGEENYERSYC
jgi:rhodanese-related sulfurtransferase